MSFKPAFTYISARELAAILKTPGKQVAVVDVRDEDRAGGHIKNSIHSPSEDFLTTGIEGIRKETKEIPTVVFHCALSQVRGPKAARIYSESTEEVRSRGVNKDIPIPQEILVLRGGFTEFQALYKNDKDLVEDNEPE